MINIRKLEKELWEAADLLRADSKVTSQEYCMPVLGLIFLRYAYSRFKFVEADMFDKMNTLANGVAQQNLSPVKTGELQITVPTDNLLQQFEAVVEPMLQKIIIMSNQIEKAKETRDRLLPKLMSGEIEV